MMTKQTYTCLFLKIYIKRPEEKECHFIHNIIARMLMLNCTKNIQSHPAYLIIKTQYN